MAPKKGKETLLELCTMATNVGNSISVRMLEYLGTVKHQPHGFKELACDFLDVSRILWSIEAGLNEAGRSQTKFPQDMTQELDKKFRQTNDDFIVLNQMLTKFLEYERKGRLGRFQRGLHSMFSDDEIHKLRESLGRSRDALRMSALVFRWSLGDAKADASVGIGYTGLAAVLERMNPGKVPSINTSTLPAEPPIHTPTPQTPPPSQVPDRLPPLPQISTVSDRHANYSLFPRLDEDINALVSHHIEPRTSSLDHRNGDAHSIHNSIHRHGDDHSIHRNGDARSIKALPSIRSSKYTTASTMRDLGPHSSVETAPTDVTLDDRLSVKTADSFTQIEDMISEIEFNDKQSQKVVRIKADPSTVPRWTPKQNSGSSSPALKTALISAIQQRKHKMIEQLLDCGVPPNSGMDLNVLREAVLNRDAESVRLLLLFGADPNSVDKSASTALMAAIETSFIEGTKLLLKYAADPNLPAGPRNETPLAVAVAETKVELVQLLLTYGANANMSTSDGNTLLDMAVTKTSPRRLTELLLIYGSDANGKSNRGETPLFVAIQAGRLDLMQLLLDHGADPNLPGPKHPLWPATYFPKGLQLLLSRGATFKRCPGILELATSINNIESVTTLIRAGVDINAKKDGTYTPLCTAIRDNRTELVSLLLASGADPNEPAAEYPAFKCVTHHRTHLLPQLVAAGSDLHKPKGIIEKAVAHNNKDALMYLLEQGVSANDRTPEGYTALTTAIREAKADFVDILLAHDADPGIRGQDWPICMAVKQPAILKKLLPKVHNPRAVKGVMEMAVGANELESVKLLLAAGVSVEDKNGGVFSPLTTAIREGHKEIVKYLLDEAGADVNAPGEHLPIIKAIRRFRGDTEIIEMLLARGADINLMYRGWNAILQAVENGDATVLQTLVEHGGTVDLDAKDESGRTVVEIVEERGWDEAVTILLGSKEQK
ncbi:hypothetical protein PV08_04315 [Exophiala spinifera]|uniref:Uncharacterized protein n=1 Tax=Exophiala spinifera TaxID=91928 RepID=A0A0D2C0G8_9EURO|nr:uncharacterized protein PV08_04315 [Exophiala spinifera]KIW17124.1 hypothetical protein PV08_04315 [Exophiala spinifera]